MHESMQKEQFSRAYVQAVAAVAGFSWAAPSVDDDSIDMYLARRNGGGAIRSPRLDLQLKCHAAPPPTDDPIRFPLSRKNYDDLRNPHVMIPRIIILVLVPAKPENWLRQTEKEMTLRRCGYWASIRGGSEVKNEVSVTVDFPRNQRFTPESLSAMMGRIAEGDLP